MCDTFAATPEFTGGALVFGKNSDREPNEAQALEWRPPREHPSGATVRCTYLEIPQVRETRGVLLSRPFWMWGAEMGANDRGVVIGNEAVFTRAPLDRKNGLTGMDLLRLALERAGTAREALEVVVDLLGRYGQGGACGYENKKMAYHNSFILADPREAWVLETAGPYWAAVRVKKAYAISNGLTIGAEYDLGHPDLIPAARASGRLKRGRDFHFARAFSDVIMTWGSACRARRARAEELLREREGRLDAAGAFGLLRDHRGGDSYRPDAHLLGDRLCAHAANGLTRHPTQSTGSLVAVLTPESRTFWATGTSAPCTGVFKPIWLEGDVLPDLGPAPEGTFREDSLWWRHERLHRRVILDHETRIQAFRGDRDRLEAEFLAAADTVAPEGRFALTREAFQRAFSAEDEWLEAVERTPVRRRPNAIYRSYWAKQNRKAGLEIV